MGINHHLESLRQLVQVEDYCLTESVYKAVKHFFEASVEMGFGDELQRRTPEYSQSEYLLNADCKGGIINPSQETIIDYRNTYRREPTFAHWLNEEPHAQPTLSVARWLAHLIGLRHRCIQLFLDHPNLPNATFVQIRSFNKYTAAGRFDLPVAGHVTGTSSLTQSVETELQEELGLDLKSDVTNFQQIGAYDVVIPPEQPDYIDVEYSTVYRGILKPHALSKFRFIDGEAAAIALFSVPELRILLQDFPDRVSGIGGIAEAFPFYLESNCSDEYMP